MFTARVASAQLSGTFNATGSVRISTAGLDFGGNGVPPGAFTISAGPTGSFALFTGLTGAVADVNLTTHPVNTPFTDLNFLTFTTQPTLAFDATLLAVGGFSSALCAAPAAAGQQCTPTNSPFAFINTSSTASTFTFALSGVAHDGAGTGTFTSVFAASAQTSYQNLLEVLNAGGSLSASYTASVQVTPVTTVPEPASGALLFPGAVVLAVVVRRRVGARV
jgi:hypothetical protein